MPYMFLQKPKMTIFILYTSSSFKPFGAESGIPLFTNIV